MEVEDNMEKHGLLLSLWALVFLSSYFTNSDASLRESFNGVYFPGRLQIRRDQPIPGSAGKLYEITSEEAKGEAQDEFRSTHSRQRRSRNPDMTPKETVVGYFSSITQQ